MYQLVTPYAEAIVATNTTTADIQVERLTSADQVDVLRFLSRRPIHTVAMVGFIRDNGIESPLNRGTFYGCRNRDGKLEGVALIGHATLMETTTDRALEAFAEVAKKCANANMIMGESQRVDCFWQNYRKGGQAMRLACRELLFELQWPIEVREAVPGLRRATLDDLELVMPIQAQMAFEESGINPIEREPNGFRERCKRRIQHGRTWVVVEENILLFKADIISETNDVAYLEGIWVNPQNRGKRFGLRCLSQLAKNILANKKSLCLLANELNTHAHEFYQRAGYKLRGIYDTIFLS